MYFDDIEDLIASESDRTTPIDKRPSSWLKAGAIFGLAGGLITGTLGALLTFTSWLTWIGTLKQFEHWLGTVLLVATLPLMAVGAHFLDLIEKKKRTHSFKSRLTVRSGSRDS